MTHNLTQCSRQDSTVLGLVEDEGIIMWALVGCHTRYCPVSPEAGVSQIWGCSHSHLEHAILV